MLDDEEINSCEGEDVDDHMLNVAIMKSVVENVAPQLANTECGAESPRYGLRKRQRPGDSMDALEAPPVTATIMNGRLSLVRAPRPAGLGSMGGAAVPNLQQEPAIQGAQTGDRITTTRSVQPIAPNIAVNAAPTDHTLSLHPAAQPSIRPITAKKRKPPSRPTSKPKGSGTVLRSPPALVPSSGPVPNPLSRSTPPPSTARPASAEVKTGARTVQHGSSSVPCPLPEAVPCPLPEHVAPEPAHSERRVTIADPPVLTRSRIFSVDLDRKSRGVLALCPHNLAKFLPSW